MRPTERYIPKNALPVTEDAALGVVYVYPFAGKFGAIAYRGNANKSEWHYTFKKDTQLDEHIAKWFQGIRDHKQMLSERKESRKAPHIFKVGDIVSNSWGYDQTNVDWYRVTKTSDHFVWLAQIAGDTVNHDGAGPMSGYSTPAIDVSADDPSKWGVVETAHDGVLLNKSHRHAATGGNINMRHGSCTKWDGKPKYESWYA